MSSGIYQEAPKSNQEAFDRVWDTFIVEGKPRAINSNGRCAYRIEEGHGCAIGCQLPDALYSREMEYLGIWAVRDKWPEVRQHFGSVTENLQDDLQRVHDLSQSSDIEVFTNHLRDVAKKYGLTVAA